MWDWLRHLVTGAPRESVTKVVSDADSALWGVEQSISYIDAQVVATETMLASMDAKRDALALDVAEQTMAVLDFDAETPLERGADAVRAAGYQYLTHSMPLTLLNMDLHHTALERRLLSLQVKQFELAKAGEECRDLQDKIKGSVPTEAYMLVPPEVPILETTPEMLT